MTAPAMIDVAELRRLYADKLMATGSHDAAFTKAVWVAFKAGIAAGRSEKEVSDAKA